MCKLKRKREEILACEDLKNVKGVHCITRCTTKQKIVWKFAGALIMPQIHRYVVLYIRLWMWALQVPPGLRAVGWIFLQHQYLQCWQLIAAPVCLKRPWPAELFIMSIQHGQLHRCSTGARCSETQLTMWMSDSSFLRGVRIQKFCFKKWK